MIVELFLRQTGMQNSAAEITVLAHIKLWSNEKLEWLHKRVSPMVESSFVPCRSPEDANVNVRGKQSVWQLTQSLLYPFTWQVKTRMEVQMMICTDIPSVFCGAWWTLYSWMMWCTQKTFSNCQLSSAGWSHCSLVFIGLHSYRSKDSI